jgi:hypothetical protein
LNRGVRLCCHKELLVTEICIQVVPASCLDGIDAIPAPDGVDVSVAELSKYAMGWEDSLRLVVSHAGDIASGVIAMWLYDTLFVRAKSKPKKARIGNQDVDLQTQDVVRAMKEAIEKQDANRPGH